MKFFIYTALVCAFGAFWLGCAEVEYVDDEISEIIDEGENIVNNVGESIANTTNQKAIDSPKIAKSKPKPTPKSTKNKPTPLTKSQNKSAPKSANHTNDLGKINDSPTIPSAIQGNKLLDSPMNQPQNLPNSQNNSIDSPKAQNPSDSRIVNKSTPRTKPLFDASRLNQPLSQLQTQCDSHNLQKCEDLGRIYAVQEKRDLATAHYKMACAKGNGRIMSCFFNSLIFANNGDDATSREYLDAIDTDTLNALKIDEAELMLSIGEIALIKDKLKISCTSGESTSCNALLSVFKIRGELGEARAFFGVECNRTKRQNSAPCIILKKM